MDAQLGRALREQAPDVVGEITRQRSTPPSYARSPAVPQ
jgi:hypothetical protein